MGHIDAIGQCILRININNLKLKKMELIHVITRAELYSLLRNENVFSAFKLALNAEDDDKKVEFEEKIYLLNNKIAHEKYFDKVDPESFWKIEDEDEKRMYFYNLKSQCLLDELKNAVDEEIKRKNKQKENETD